MFYEKEPDKELRFGDVLRGCIATTPNIRELILPDQILSEGYNIDVDLPMYSVVVTPCCSIDKKEKIISLTPLIEVRNSFFDNPYLAEDLTRINRAMTPEQTVAPHIWDQFPPEEKQKRLNEKVGYAFLELFIYEKNEWFPKYTIHRKQGSVETNYYMINFKNIYKLNYKEMRTPIESKCLQLSVQARAELRDKMSYYYARVPKEDKILLEGD